MLPEERRQKIVSIIQNEGFANLQQLASIFNVSIYTIRRDIADLTDKGLVKKTHGGAVKVEKTMWLPSIEEGRKEAVSEKNAIARKAASYIEDGDTIFLMGSTITEMIIPYLTTKKLTIVTNSLDVGKVLSNFENIETSIIGGKIKNYKGNVLGGQAVDYISRFYFDKSFIPCAGIDAKHGITTSTTDSADFTRAVINSTKENIVIADYRKVGRIAFSFICEIDSISRLITDEKADRELIEYVNKKGLRTDIVKVE
jgi:DeoR/GlpR family transcriptional regulator of sugar metabolism